MARSHATMNQLMSNLVCVGFHHILVKYGRENVEVCEGFHHENVEIQKENLMSSHFSTLVE